MSSLDSSLVLNGSIADSGATVGSGSHQHIHDDNNNNNSDDNEIFNIFQDSSDPLFRLTNINSPDYLEQLAPIVREQLIENDALDDLVINLEDISLEKSKNLEAICKQSENDILSSVTNISKIKASSNLLQQEVSEISTTMEKTGSKLIEKKKNYLNLKNNYNKINQSIDLINSSLQMLELTNKVHDLIKKEKFFIALKNLDDLKNIHLKNNQINHFKFSQQIYNSIPILTDLIKQKSFESVRKLLSHLDKNFVNMGEILFEYAENLISKWYQKIQSDKNNDLNKLLREFSLNSPIELTIRLSDSTTKLNPLNNEYIQIPLNPIYDAILIYESINELEDLKATYLKELSHRKDRLFHQILKIKSTAATGGGAGSANSSTLKVFKDSHSLKELLHKLSAFFIVDSIINRNTRYKLRTAEASRNLWEAMIDKLIPLLVSYINKIQNDRIDELLELKQSIGIFVKLMENYSFPTRKIYDEILILLFKRFQKILLDNFEEEFKISLYEDDSMPMRINDLTLYKKVLAVSWYQTDNPDIIPISPINPNDHRGFPKHLPFSQLYPMTCAQIRSFINKSLQFLEFNIFNKNYKLLSQLLISSLDELMSSKIGLHLKEKVNSTNREEIAQNLINLDFFYISSNEVSKLLTSSNAMMVNISNNSNSTASININLLKSLPQKNFPLNSTEVFKEIKKTAESKLFEMVDGKVMQLMEMIEFDFETTIINDEPSMYIIELGEFLKAMFNSTFSNLPSQVLNLLIFRTFDILADNFKDVLKTSPLITDVAILNFDSDLTYIEEILNELKDSGNAGNDNEVGESDQDTNAKSNNRLRGKFEELRQVILLLKNQSFEEFRTFKVEKYNKIDYELGAQLLNKLRIKGMSISEIEMQNKPGSPDPSGGAIKSPSSMNFARFYKFRNTSK